MVKNLCTRKRVKKPNKCKKVRGCKVASGSKRSFCRKAKNKTRKPRKPRNSNMSRLTRLRRYTQKQYRRLKKLRGGRKHRKTHRRGGSSDAPLASSPYSSMRTVPNPHFAYTGKGGSNEPVQTFVGTPYGAALEDLPGVRGAHDGNYYNLNTYDVQPEMNPINERVTDQQYQLRGGKKSRRTRKKGRKGTKRGGGFFGNNMLQTIGHDFSSAYSQLNGNPVSANPIPYEDQVYYGQRAEDNINYLKVNITGE